MNDHNLSVYVLPVNPDSDWKYLYIVEAKKIMKDIIARRPILEPAYMTVYTNYANWHIVGSNKGRGFEETKLHTHLIGDEEAATLWEHAIATRDANLNFRLDLEKIRQALFPKVERHTPFYLNPVD